MAGGDDDAEPRALVDVDVRIDAALADQPELREALEERRADLGALADQHERLRIHQTLGERIDVLDVVVPDRDVVPLQLAEARERAEGVVVVVENRDPQRAPNAARPRAVS
jgi:hypothetical protein